MRNWSIWVKSLISFCFLSVELSCWFSWYDFFSKRFSISLNLSLLIPIWISECLWGNVWAFILFACSDCAGKLAKIGGGDCTGGERADGGSRTWKVGSDGSDVVSWICNRRHRSCSVEQFLRGMRRRFGWENRRIWGKLNLFSVFLFCGRENLLAVFGFGFLSLWV